MSAQGQKGRDLDAPLTSISGCVWTDWGEGGEESVQPVSGRTRGQAIARFVAGAGEGSYAFVEVGVWKRHIRIFNLRDWWEGQGGDRWLDRYLDEHGIDSRFNGDAENPRWDYVNADTGAVVELPRLPDEPPADCAPDEDDYAWEFVHASHPRATEVWICGWRRNGSPPKPTDPERAA